MEASAATAPRPARLLVACALAALALFVGSLVGLAVIIGGAPGCSRGEAVGGLDARVPRRLMPIYEQAAERYHLGERGPSILAAINWVETGFGTNLGISSAGAEGWMQFEPESWAVYGVDGDGDGIKDPDDPWDAIFAAAGLLHSDGAPTEWSRAIWDYNHADWYVEKVLRFARKFAADNSTAGGGSTCGGAVPPDEAVARMLAEAERLSPIRARTGYAWGGSHGITPTPRNGPFDCSSAVSHELQVGGFENETMTTEQLASWGDAGPGEWVTIFVKADAGEDSHTFLRFSPRLTPPSERYWGTSGFWHPTEGPGFIPEWVFEPDYLSGFVMRHPPGL